MVAHHLGVSSVVGLPTFLHAVLGWRCVAALLLCVGPGCHPGVGHLELQHLLAQVSHVDRRVCQCGLEAVQVSVGGGQLRQRIVPVPHNIYDASVPEPDACRTLTAWTHSEECPPSLSTNQGLDSQRGQGSAVTLHRPCVNMEPACDASTQCNPTRRVRGPESMGQGLSKRAANDNGPALGRPGLATRWSERVSSLDIVSLFGFGTRVAHRQRFGMRPAPDSVCLRKITAPHERLTITTSFNASDIAFDIR